MQDAQFETSHATSCGVTAAIRRFSCAALFVFFVVPFFPLVWSVVLICVLVSVSNLEIASAASRRYAR